MNIHWLKLDVNILDNSKIKLIRKMPDGDTLVILWLGLLCLAMKSEKFGHILICENTPYTDEELSTRLDININTVKLGLEIFSRYGMIKFDKYNTIQINNFSDKQSIDQIERQRLLGRERVRKYREKKKSKNVEFDTKNSKCNDVTQIETQCNDIDIDKIREDKNKINIYSDILKYWNTKQIIVHKDSYVSKMKTKVNTILKDYKVNDIKQSIDNYNTILNDDKYYFNYKWELADFLRRGFEKFRTDVAFTNYLDKNHKQKKSSSDIKADELGKKLVKELLNESK